MIQDNERILDVASVGVVGATLLGWLPHIAAGLSIVWMIIRISETHTFQLLLHKITGWSWIDPKAKKVKYGDENKP